MTCSVIAHFQLFILKTIFHIPCLLYLIKIVSVLSTKKKVLFYWMYSLDITLSSLDTSTNCMHVALFISTLALF